MEDFFAHQLKVSMTNRGLDRSNAGVLIRYAFQKKTSENKIHVHYSQKDFEDDLRKLNEL